MTSISKNSKGWASRIPKGPSPHLFYTELACHDGTPYPVEWYGDKLVHLAQLFEEIRHILGDRPIVILSAYRTPMYNAKIEGAATGSQHIQGRALDLWHPDLTASQTYARVKQAYRSGQLPMLGGLGLYKTFIHIDTRPSDPKRLALWYGKGVIPQ